MEFIGSSTTSTRDQSPSHCVWLRRSKAFDDSQQALNVVGLDVARYAGAHHSAAVGEAELPDDFDGVVAVPHRNLRRGQRLRYLGWCMAGNRERSGRCATGETANTPHLHAFHRLQPVE